MLSLFARERAAPRRRASARGALRRALPWLLLGAAAACAKTKFEQIRPHDRRVLVLAIDGLDFETLKPLFDSGQLPALAELRRRGLRVPLVGDRASPDPASVGLDPAMSWTTIATGFPAIRLAEGGASHSVRNVVVPVKGSYADYPATSQHRRLPNFWDVLGAAGVRCAIVGWWTTWPAEPVNGHLVTDRFFLEKFGLGPFGPAGRVDLPAVPADWRRGASHLTWPEELSDALAAELDGKVKSPEWPVFRQLRELAASARDSPGAPTRRHLQQVEQALRTDHAVKEALLALLAKDPSIRFAACYLDALDVATHLFWMHIDPQPWLQHKDPAIRRKLPADFRAYAGMVPMVAAAIDRMVKELCDAMGPESVVLVVTDHAMTSDTETTNRDFSLDRLSEALGLLARAPDGSIDWSRTICFDRTPWETGFVRRLSINFKGEWPQGCVELPSPADRVLRWREVQAKVLGARLVAPFSPPGMAVQDDVVWDWTMGEGDSYVTLVPMFPGDTRIRLPDGRQVTFEQLFPQRPTSGRHADPGMLLLAYPGALGERNGRRGIPMGKGGGFNRQVAPLVLALYGIPCSRREDESAATADFLYWMLDFEEAQRMVLMPRVESYAARVRFDDPESLLGGRRRELARELRAMGFTFEGDAARTPSAGAGD